MKNISYHTNSSRISLDKKSPLKIGSLTKSISESKDGGLGSLFLLLKQILVYLNNLPLDLIVSVSNELTIISQEKESKKHDYYTKKILETFIDALTVENNEMAKFKNMMIDHNLKNFYFVLNKLTLNKNHSKNFEKFKNLLNKMESTTGDFKVSSQYFFLLQENKSVMNLDYKKNQNFFPSTVMDCTDNEIIHHLYATIDQSLIFHQRCLTILKIKHRKMKKYENLMIKLPIFGQSLTILVYEKPKYLSKLLVDFLNALNEKEIHLVKGIFRNSCMVKDLEKLKRVVNKEQFDNKRHLFDVITVCDGLKSFLREMPTSLIPDFFLDNCKNYMNFNEEERIKFLKYNIAQSPLCKVKNLKYLLNFLHQLEKHKSKTCMDANNLGCVLGPSLLFKHMDISTNTCFFSSLIVHDLIEFYGILFQIPSKRYFISKKTRITTMYGNNFRMDNENLLTRKNSLKPFDI